MQKTNTISSKINLTLTSNPQGKGSIPAIRQTEPYNFDLQECGYWSDALNT